MVVRLYLAQPIDCSKVCQERIYKIMKFLFVNELYTKIIVCGAGIGEDSPIINPETSSPEYKGIISAYDLRKIRECDIMLVISDDNTFAAGTFIEMEYARNLGLYIIVLWLGKPLKNIFVQTYANKIIYSYKELEDILRDITQ